VKKCHEVFEQEYQLPGGVVYMGGNYVNVVPQSRKAAKYVNRRYDAFRNGWRMGIENQVEDMMDELREKAE